MLANLSSFPVLFALGYLAGCVVDESGEVFEMCKSFFVGVLVETKHLTGWLGHWANQYTLREYVSVTYYLGWYATIVVGIVSTYLWVSVMATFASIRVSRIIHNRLTASLLASTFRWLDVTPVSRIVSRCTQDIQSVDGPLVHLTSHLIACVVMCISRLVAIALSAPVFILPGFVIGLLGVVLGQVYIKAQLSVKRERSIAKVVSCLARPILY
jgi:ABC-type multidrug transport system fused ATPase/permease subunit